ncbi:hypothetical protein ACQR3P_01020 [Rhodococcus sp. IEGM1300]
MHRNTKFGGCGLIAAVVLLSGCTSLLQGKQYVFPKAGEPSATVRMKYESGTSLDAITFNDSGCYAGYTTLPGTDEYIEAPVVAGKELVLTYKRVLAGAACQIPFSFTPEAGATYTLQSGSWSEAGSGLLSMFTRDQHYCGVGLVKTVGDKQSVERIQQLRIKTAFACLTFVK